MSMTDSQPGRWIPRIAAALTVLGALAWAQPAGGATYYVRTSGSDGNDGLSPAEALRTLSEAADRVGAGDTVYVGAGTYAEKVVIKDTDGTSAARISFMADSSGAKTGDSGDVIVTGSSLRDYCFDVDGSDYIRIEGFRATGAAKCGIRTKNSNNVTLKSCRLYGNHDEGVKLDHGNGALVEDCQAYNNGKEGIHGHDNDDLTVRDCVAYGNDKEGIRAHGDRITITGCTAYANDKEGIELDEKGSGGLVEKCIVYANDKHGIKLKGKTVRAVNCISYDNKEDGIYADRCDQVTLYNNTTVGNQKEGIHLKETDATLRNNISAYNARHGIRKEHGSVDSDYNLVWNNAAGGYDGLSAGPDDLAEDPLFEDLCGDDYHLASGSPAIDVGADLGAPAEDFEGQVRSGPVDLGADEFGRPPRIVRVICWREVNR